MQSATFGVFAWSHLWWAFAYPVAGFLGIRFPNQAFVLGGGLALALLAGVWLSHQGRLGAGLDERTTPAPTDQSG